MRGNPSGNSVPECEPRKGVSWRLTEFDATSHREDSAGSPDTCSLVLCRFVIPKRKRLRKGGIKKVTDDDRPQRIVWRGPASL
jgi:hypothetical protein